MHEDKVKRAEELLRKEFGSDWKKIAQEIGTWELTHYSGRDLTSFIAFPERNEGGKNTWRGNCSPKVIRKIKAFVQQCLPFRKKEEFLLLDPMCGSGTSHDVASEMRIQSVQYDLNPSPANGRGNWNALKDEVEDCADLVFLHPPYHNIIKYSGYMWGKPHPDDLSRCETYEDFKEDDMELTWFNLLCAVMEHLGGTVTLQELYMRLEEHPKAKKNSHYKERLRATIYEHRKYFQTNGKGTYRLKHAVQRGLSG